MKFTITRIATLGATVALALILGARGGGGNNAVDDGKGKVYYLSSKPKQDEIWQRVAKAYTRETGVPVKVVTAALGTYEQTLKAEVVERDVPALSQINDSVGMQSRKDCTVDLSDTNFHRRLLDKKMVMGEDGKVYGTPYIERGHGIIYNKAIMDKYFTMPDTRVKSVGDIKGFNTLGSVVEDIQVKKGDLGIGGVSASISLKPGEDWRWQTHLADLPVYFGYTDDNKIDMPRLDFKYNKEFKNIFDLYLKNSTIDPKLANSKAITDSMTEFALGKAAMVQDGNWAYGQISEVDGNMVKPENAKIMPIYNGFPNEAKQGINIGAENFLSISPKASEADQKAPVDLVNWPVSSDAGKKFMVGELGFIPPFDTFTESEQPSGPLAKGTVSYMSNKDLVSVSWEFTTFPSQQFKDDFGRALAQYAMGQMDWGKIVDLFKKSWEVEKQSQLTLCGDGYGLMSRQGGRSASHEPATPGQPTP